MSLPKLGHLCTIAPIYANNREITAKYLQKIISLWFCKRCLYHSMIGVDIFLHSATLHKQMLQPNISILSHIYILPEYHVRRSIEKKWAFNWGLK